jgi:DNA-directed RNA polymerase subunit RPC12/RpoP
MLVVFGSSVVEKEITHYDFDAAACPKCSEKLKIIEVSRWFSMFFIRLFKIDLLGYYYWCTNCQTEFSNSQIEHIKLDNEHI